MNFHAFIKCGYFIIIIQSYYSFVSQFQNLHHIKKFAYSSILLLSSILLMKVVLTISILILWILCSY